MDVEPLTDACRVVLTGREHACVGVSPFNGYFTADRIRELASWAHTEFKTVHYFMPDLAAAHTLQALGYPPERALHKARRQGCNLRNKITEALASLGIDQPRRFVLDTETLTANPAYQALHTEAHHRYDTDTDFAAHCQDASHWVLTGKLPPGTQPSDEQLQQAVQYFLAELPLFIDTPAIVGAGSSVFCYHQPPPFLTLLYQRELSWQPAPGQAFATVTGTPPHHPPSA